MRRREFSSLLGGTALVRPLAAEAQQRSAPVIGFLSARSAAESAHLVNAFRRGLAELGLFDGQNVTVEYSWADSQYERLPVQAADLLKRPVDVVVAFGGDMTAHAALSATKTVPIVAVFIGDPVANGFIASLNRPGGNVTGVSNLNAVIESKRLGLLRELNPRMADVGALLNPASPTFAAQKKNIEDAARVSNLTIKFWNASTDDELEIAFESMAGNRDFALLVPADAYFASARAKMAALALRHLVPTIHSLREAAVAGALMSYGNDLPDTYRLIGTYAGRIIRGEKPVDMPVIQPTKFEFVLNLKTAKALGLTIPAGVLAIADEVIE